MQLRLPIETKNLTALQPPMLLIDRIIGIGEDWIISEILHEQPTFFSLPNGQTPAWVCLEYIAQTAAAFDGIQRSEEGLSPRVALLLGTRKFSIKQAFFAANEHTKVHVKRVLITSDNIVAFESKVFRCEYGAEDQLIATALVKAIAPNNFNEIIQKSLTLSNN